MLRSKVIILMSVLSLIAIDIKAQSTIPEPMPLVDENGYDVLNILLIGSATEDNYNPGLTDSLILVSINRSVNAVSILSIPRDLYVYLPDYGMAKINQAYLLGETHDQTRTGVQLLKETILYNLGVQVDFYVRVNFTSFGSLIDRIGGITLSVDCVIEDWRLKSPELDKYDPNNWEMYTLPIGVHHMDSHLALWYVRSRRTSTDLDRGRRQQDVIRAIWRQIQADGLLNIENLPEIWEDVTKIVETDLTLPDILGLMPMAALMNTSDFSYYTFRVKKHVKGAYNEAGQAVLLAERAAIIELMQQVIAPPTASQIHLARPTIAIVNASGIPQLDIITAQRLELEGFHTILLNEWSTPRDYNKIIDYTGEDKGNPIDRIQRVLRVTPEGVEVSPDPNRQYDYKVYIGNQYQFWTCTRDVIQPSPTPTSDLTQGSP